MTASQAPSNAVGGDPATDRSGNPATNTADDDATVRPTPAQRFRRGQKDARTSERFRGDVAGLRAIAVGLVLLYHAGLRFVPGGFVGVDVFFVISGYLITRQLISEIDRTGRISLIGFYARRAKRILPAAAVTLVGTAVAVWLWVPRVQWHDIAGDIVSAATYVVNWRLADRAVDYLAQDSPPSPVQHFWSLAVEEQFYVVWPLLIIAVLFVTKMMRRSNVRPVLWIGLVVVAVPSFVWSVVYTSSDPGRAFFVSTTRMWELAIGAGVALVGANASRIPRGAAIVVGWLGLAAIVAAGVLVNSATTWPGYAAALPTVGAAAVILAGAAAGSAGPVAILGTRPFRWVGDLSYSLYLWHWPMIVVATDHWNGLSVKRGLAIVALSVIPAWITYHVIENPLRYSRSISKSPRFALSLGGNFTLVGVCAGLALLVTATLSGGVAPGADRLAFGASASTSSGGDPASAMPEHVDFITPDPLRAGADIPVTTPDGCFQNNVSTQVLWCTYGNKNATTEVALVGDSKMDEWFPAFELLAEQNNWKLVIAVKAACGFTSATTIVGEDATKPYTSCTAWNKSLLARLVAEHPAYVVTSQGSGVAADAARHKSADAMAKGMEASWAALDAVGTKVIALANNPHPSVNVDQCVDQHRKRLSACAFSPALHLTDEAYMTQVLAVAGAPKVPMIDLFSAICPAARCWPVIGNVLVYRAGSHLTATYIKSMTPQLATALTGVGVMATFTPPSH